MEAWPKQMEEALKDLWCVANLFRTCDFALATKGTCPEGEGASPDR